MLRTIYEIMYSRALKERLVADFDQSKRYEGCSHCSFSTLRMLSASINTTIGISVIPSLSSLKQKITFSWRINQGYSSTINILEDISKSLSKPKFTNKKSSISPCTAAIFYYYYFFLLFYFICIYIHFFFLSFFWKWVWKKLQIL